MGVMKEGTHLVYPLEDPLADPQAGLLVDLLVDSLADLLVDLRADHPVDIAAILPLYHQKEVISNVEDPATLETGNSNSIEKKDKGMNETWKGKES